MRMTKMVLTQNHVEVGLTVGDIDRSLAFYTETLGFAEVAAMPVGWGGTLHILRSGDAVIKLAENDSVPSATNPSGGPTGGVGLRWFTLWVSDVDAVVAECAAGGGSIAEPVNNDYPGVKFAMIADPDGNWIEFVQTVEA
jgi:catechol 2,3-dioxygenase-like lactoylglutathione lyase family enzyme